MRVKVVHRRAASANSQPLIVFANVILRSASGKSAVAAGPTMSPRNIREYLPTKGTLEEGRRLLGDLGFQINMVAPTHITIAAGPEQFEKVFRARLKRQEAPYFQAPRPDKRRQAMQSFFVADGPLRIPSVLQKVVEAVELPGPITYYVTATPPALSYDHLEVPDDVARDMDALKAHARGVTGAGIALAMVDSGFMTPMHPYYSGRGYNLQPLVPDPSDPNPNVDEVGHGTGISACALAVAPGVTYTVYKIYSTNFTAAFSRAVAANPAIITCSWGVPVNTALRMAINNAVANGIVVCFACGNGGPVGWPGSEPAVVSVGGGFIADDDSVQASTYASSGTSANNPGRQVPDLCGIVGQAPKGIFIALPTQPDSLFDNSLGGAGYPNMDETATDDGWLVASGTSSASPMVAATAALVMQADPTMLGNPSGVRAALVQSCRDIVSGSSASGEGAGSGADLATGAGLVQAYRAIRATDIWIKDNPSSDIGLVPTHSRRPAWPPHAHWVSPDVKVFPSALGSVSADFDPTPEDGPVFNLDNFVYVRVRNRGPQTTGAVNVRLYYADPSTNLVFPTDWNDGQSGIPGSGSISVGGAGGNLQTVPSIPANGDIVVPLPYVWRPPDPTTATQTQTLPDGRTTGHFCLLARLESADDPIIVTGGGQTSVIQDNNIGMKNVQVYSAPPGHMFLFSFYMSCPAKRNHGSPCGLLFDLSRLPRTARVKAVVDPRFTKGARLVNGSRREKELTLKVGKRLAGLAEVSLPPSKRVLVRVAVAMPSTVKPGDYAFSAIQFTDREATGGVELVARVQTGS